MVSTVKRLLVLGLLCIANASFSQVHSSLSFPNYRQTERIFEMFRSKDGLDWWYPKSLTFPVNLDPEKQGRFIFNPSYGGSSKNIPLLCSFDLTKSGNFILPPFKWLSLPASFLINTPPTIRDQATRSLLQQDSMVRKDSSKF